MAILTQINHDRIQYLVSKEYDSIYSRLTRILNPQQLDYFARTAKTSNERAWITDRSGYVPFSSLSEEHKALATNFIQHIEPGIKAEILKDNELAGITNEIMTVPSEDQIYVLIQGESKVIVTLGQWGCKDLGGRVMPNALERIRKLPKSNHTDVNLNIKFSDGSIASNTTFNFVYKDNQESIITDENGNINLGQLKNDSSFSIFSSSPQDAQSVIVKEDNSYYQVELPLYTNIKIKVVNQVGEIVPSQSINVDYLGVISNHITDQNGLIELLNVKVTKDPFILYDNNNQTISNSYRLSKDDNELLFELKLRRAAEGFVKIINEQGQIVPQYSISVVVEDVNYELLSDENGIITVPDVEIDHYFKVQDANNKYNSNEFKLTDDEKEFEFRVNPPVFNDINIGLVDHKNNPLPNVPLDIFYSSGELNRLTNENGQVILPHDSLTDGEKVKVAIHLNDKSGRPLKAKIKSFKYDKFKHSYVIKLTKFNKWWLLLLLLPLALLLLLECNKDLYFRTIDKSYEHPIPNVEVAISYEKHFLYKNGSFFTSEVIQRNGISDSLGHVTFDSLSYTYFSALFKRKTPLNITADNRCYILDENYSKRFHGLPHKNYVNLPMVPKPFTGHIRVIDADSDQPIHLADVELTFEDGSEIKTHIDSSSTNTLGRAIFNNIPKCGQIRSAIASKYGYYPDTLFNLSVLDIALTQNEVNSTIYLKPIKESIEFFVINCRNNQPLIAEADIFIDGIKVNEQSIKTNINGVGRGIYQDVHILKKIQIRAKHNHFHNGELANQFIVNDFILKPDSLRTICLEPVDASIDFINLDSLTMDPIQGVQNIVSVLNSNSIRIDTIFSTSNGVFTVAGISVGDEISITSTLDPYYYPNIDAVKNIKFEDLITLNPPDKEIILNPKVIEIDFETRDIANDTLVDDASLTVFINGKKINTPNNSGSGTFNVKTRYNDIISIEAAKDGYLTNIDAINKKATQDLLSGPITDRIIPMNHLPNEDCRFFVSGGLICDSFIPNWASKIFELDDFSEYVGNGIYPYANIAFPNASKHTFDGLVIGKNTRVIIYEKPYFEGKILFDRVGPLIFNNGYRKTSNMEVNRFMLNNNADIPSEFTIDKRQWSNTNMIDWAQGSLKVLCN